MVKKFRNPHNTYFFAILFLVSAISPKPLFAQSFIQIGADINGENSQDESGSTISLSDDGSTVAIGAPFNDDNGKDAGHVRIYEWDGTTWVQKGKDIDGIMVDDRCGSAVSLNDDGSVVAIGAYRNDGNGTDAGHVRVFSWQDSLWLQKGSDIEGEASGDRFGTSVSISADGNVLAAGAPMNDAIPYNSGHVRVYDWSGTSWIQRGSDIDGQIINGQSGSSVSLNAYGSVVAIGTPLGDEGAMNTGQVQVYFWNVTDWTQRGSDINGDSENDLLGSTVSLSADGKSLAIGAPGNSDNGFEAGHVLNYLWDSTEWFEKGSAITGKENYDYVGSAVALNSDGNILAIGAYGNDDGGNNAGQARIYLWTGSEWLEYGNGISGPSDWNYLGKSISISADGAIMSVGAPIGGNKFRTGYVATFTTAVGFVKNNIDHPFQVLPNPTTGSVTIPLDNTRQDLNLVIRNLLGQVVQVQSYKGVDRFTTDIIGSPGIYLIEITDEDGNTSTMKLLKE